MNGFEIAALIVAGGLVGLVVNEVISRKGGERLVLRLLSRVLDHTPSDDRIMRTFERDPSLGWSYGSPEPEQEMKSKR
jgi:hypothetical protein